MMIISIKMMLCQSIYNEKEKEKTNLIQVMKQNVIKHALLSVIIYDDDDDDTTLRLKFITD
jgi:hypothetical protein